MARRRRLHALGAVEILDAERNAFERPRVAGSEPSVGLRRHRQSLFRRFDNEAIERPALFDSGHLRLGEFDGGNLFLHQRIARRGKAQFGQFGQMLLSNM